MSVGALEGAFGVRFLALRLRGTRGPLEGAARIGYRLETDWGQSLRWAAQEQGWRPRELGLLRREHSV